MGKPKVYVEGDKLCAEMPALYLSPDGEEFIPMWRDKKAEIIHEEDYDVVCIPKPSFPTIIRIGKGWGRNGKDKYYYYDTSGSIRKLIKRSTKKLHVRTWMTCLEDKHTGNKWCFELIEGKIVPARQEMKI